MKSKDSLLTLGVVAVLGAAGLVLLLRDPQPAFASQVPAGAAASPAVVEPAVEPAVDPPAAAVVVDQAVAVDADAARTVAPADVLARGAGVIDGRVQVAAEVVGRFRDYSVVVEEQVNPHARSGADQKPFRRVYGPFRVDDRSTPRFAIADVPFSVYGYRVGVHVPNLNGSSQVIQLTAERWNPDVLLSISDGVPFTVRLIDQNRAAIVDTEVALRPVGTTGGTTYRATTNAFGTAVYEKVLAGDYAVVVGTGALREVTVHATGMLSDLQSLGVQSAIVVRPTGSSLRVEVFGASGHGLEGAELELYAIDTLENRRYEAKSDYAGVHTFEHVTPGRYQLNVAADGHERTSRTVRIGAAAEGGETTPVEPLQVWLAAR